MARVICFEPDPDAFRLLKMNIELNGLPAVECIHAAVADFDGPSRLFGDHRQRGGRSRKLDPASLGWHDPEPHRSKSLAKDFHPIWPTAASHS